MNSIDQFQATLLADLSHLDKRMRCVQEFYYVKEDEKLDALINFFHKAKAESSQNKYPRAAVFCSNFHCLMLTLALNVAQIDALPACKSAIAQFNNDGVYVLFITDECEDLADIDYNKFDVIINFNFPKDMESYFKRLGNVCTERNAKYATYADPIFDAGLLCEVTRTLGVGFNDIFNSLSIFSNEQTPLHLTNRDKTPYTHSHQQQEHVICSFEPDVTVNDNDVDTVTILTKIMFEYPIALEYTVSEARLKALRNSTTNQFLMSDKFQAFNASGVQYYLCVYPNGHSDQTRGTTYVFFYLNRGREKMIEADCTISVKTANWSEDFILKRSIISKGTGWAPLWLPAAEFFDSSKKYIVDGMFTIKVEGILKAEGAKSEWETPKNFKDLWNIGFEDFTIIVEKKEIKIHKNVLACQSPVFNAMLSSSMKEAIENRVEIVDFSFEIVEKAIKFCYHQSLVADITMDETFLLLQFADKYDIAVLKDNLENYLGDKITVSNVCQLVDYAVSGNALKLRNKCMDFFMDCLSKKTIVPNMGLLDNDFFVTAHSNFSCHKSCTL